MAKEIVARVVSYTRPGRLLAGLLAALLLLTIVFKPYNNGPPIRSDGAGYHIWVAAFRTLDFNFCAYKDRIGPSISVVNEAKGLCGVKYPPGVALFQAPFTILSPIPAKPNQLYSDYSHYMILLLGACLLLGTLWFIKKTMAFFPHRETDLYVAMFAGVFGTGVFHYATYDASFSHVYSMFGISAIVYLATVFRQAPDAFKSKHLLAWTLLCFWLYLVRQTNLFPIVAICIYAIWPRVFATPSIQFALSGALASIAALVLLLTYNYYVTGDIVISSYGSERFHSLGKFTYEVFFSYERGLFVYYPFAIFAMAFALYALVSAHRALALCFIVLVGLYALLYGSWHSWFLGGGMGHRGFVEIMPVGIVLVTIGLNQIESTALRYSLIGTIVASCYVTIVVMGHYWEGLFPFGGADKALFLKTLLWQG